MPSDTPRMTPSLVDALEEAGKWRVYYWKPATMQKLAALGFVEKVIERQTYDRSGYRITESGRSYLAGLKEKAA